MTEKTWRIHHAALAELHRAATHYENERAGLASDFLDAFEAGYRSAREGPITGTARHVGAYTIKRVLLTRFPYAIVIGELETENVIVAVAHVRRRPLYWRRRLSWTR